MIYLVESRSDRLARPGGDSIGVPAAGYPSQLYLHLLDLTTEEVENARPLSSRAHPRRGPDTAEWWFGDHANAYWSGIEGRESDLDERRLRSDGQPLLEVLRDRWG